jgi:ABC-2 type transport system ATP-binding protein
MEIIASVTGLTQGYRNHRVIEDLDFEVGCAVIGLLGPNGAGKTTLLRTLATVAPPQAGTLTILGEPVIGESTALKVREAIGYLPQEFGFFPSFTVAEFVRYSAWLRNVPSRRADSATREAVSAVGLEAKADVKMKALSGGMLRRAGIAAAIVGSPRLILLDEPTVGLDPAQRLEFRDLLRSITDAGVVLSTHLVEDVAAVCDEVAVMCDGGILFRDHPSALAEVAGVNAIGDSPLERGYMTVLGPMVEQTS